MKTMNNHIQKLFLKGALCFLMATLAVPAFAQDDFEEEEPAENVKVRRVTVTKENYQLMTIKGIVLDEATKNPLSGIQVKTLGNIRYSAMSDEDGTFTIKVPVFATALYVHAPEFLSQQVAIPADTNTVVRIYMLNDKYASMYEDGTSYTATRSMVAKNDHNLSIDAEIQSRMGGDVRSIQRSGMPGTGNNFFIRGINSINATSQPLIILDGVELDMQQNREMLHNGYLNNILNNLILHKVF